MEPANSPKRCRGGLLLPIVLGLSFALSSFAQSAVLDFTKLGDFSGPLAKTGFGASIGNGSSHARKPDPQVRRPLSLEVSVLSISPSIVSPRDHINTEILVRNTGREALLVPASKDDLAVMSSHNIGKQELSVFVNLARAGSDKPVEQCVGVSIGSPSVPGSMIELLPGQALLIRGSETLYQTAAWQGSIPASFEVEVGAFLQMEYFDDLVLQPVALSEKARAAIPYRIVWKAH